MASACVNNIAMSPDKFTPATYPSYGWLSPRISFSREEDKSPSKQPPKPTADSQDPPEALDPVDFEFRLHDPVAMLPADELFSDGKLMPLSVKPSVNGSIFNNNNRLSHGEISSRSPETTSVNTKTCRRLEMEVHGTTADSYLFSPKAPRCSSRWKELLGLKKLYQNAAANAKTTDSSSTTNKTTMSLLSSVSSSSSSSSTATNSKSLKHFLHRSSKSCSCNSSSASLLDHALSLPLLKDSDCESLSISSSRLSLSSSSSSHDHEDLPRLSLDWDKPSSVPNPNPFILNRNPNQNPPRMRLVKPVTGNGNSNVNSNRVGRSPMRRSTGEQSGATSRGVSVDSPRMNSSGKIVFQSLERSSSSPSSFNGGPRYKHRGMERSYSANVRVTPVLNVPVCSLRGSSKSFGFGQLFCSSPQKRECSSNTGIISNKVQLQQQHNSSSNRKG